MNVNKKSSPSYSVKIWMAGNVADAEKVCRHFCWDVGLCVTVTPTNYIYTGGEQSGFVVGLINYPRFPALPNVIEETAERLAKALAEELCQKSWTIETHSQTYYYERAE